MAYLYYNHKQYILKETIMKKIIRAWNKASLIKRILIGMLLGASLGLLFPSLSGFGILGDLFVGGLKAIAPILVLPLLPMPFPNTKRGKIPI